MASTIKFLKVTAPLIVGYCTVSYKRTYDLRVKYDESNFDKHLQGCLSWRSTDPHLLRFIELQTQWRKDKSTFSENSVAIAGFCLKYLCNFEVTVK